MGRIGRRRPRKNYRLLELVLNSDWPVAGALALVVAIFGLGMMPAWLNSSPRLALDPATLKSIVWGLFGFFTLVAIMKYRFARRAQARRRMQEHIAREETSSE